jgi:Helix-turn-helix domain
MYRVRAPIADQPAKGHTAVNDDQLITITEAAELLRTPVATLRWWRHNGIGPHSFKIGRGVRYRLSDPRAWIDQQHGPQSALRRPLRSGHSDGAHRTNAQLASGAHATATHGAKNPTGTSRAAPDA